MPKNALMAQKLNPSGWSLCALCAVDEKKHKKTSKTKENTVS